MASARDSHAVSWRLEAILSSVFDILWSSPRTMTANHAIRSHRSVTIILLPHHHGSGVRNMLPASSCGDGLLVVFKCNGEHSQLYANVLLEPVCCSCTNFVT